MELAYIVDAVALVIECRRVLKWTYVHAFFEEDDGRRHLFEFAQKQLEVPNIQRIYRYTSAAVRVASVPSRKGGRPPSRLTVADARRAGAQNGPSLPFLVSRVAAGGSPRERNAMRVVLLLATAPDHI